VLTEREAVATGGAEPCHVLWHPAGRAAYVSNYGSGSVSVVPLADDAEPRFASGVAQVFEHSGRGPDTDRQAGPHAHATLLAPDGQHLLAADLGTDEIRRYRISRGGQLAEDGLAALLPSGTGPRHMAVGPGRYVYVVGELDVALHVLRWTADRLEPAQVLPACATPLRTGHRVLPAHVAVADDRVLVSVRGSDVIARFAIRDGGARLVHESDLDVGGAWPRHFAVVGEWVVAALQNSDRVVSLRWRDSDVPGAQGRAGDFGAALSIPVPACVVPQRPLSRTSPALRYVPPSRVADNR
jgi:6-phosphogluconolactonase (cycloisomerase 2 family)